MCDSDSEVVKITRVKPKAKSRVAFFHKKPKDKPTEDPIDEKGNEGVTTPAATLPALPPHDNVTIVEDDISGIEESDKEEGTSSTPRVCI